VTAAQFHAVVHHLADFGLTFTRVRSVCDAVPSIDPDQHAALVAVEISRARRSVSETEATRSDKEE
jgi:hypothetical protein